MAVLVGRFHVIPKVPSVVRDPYHFYAHRVDHYSTAIIFKLVGISHFVRDFRKLLCVLSVLCGKFSPAMQLKQAVDSAYQLFIENDVPSPRLNAELLLLFVLNRERAYLYAHPERELNADEQSRYDEVIRERARGCPTQYITGHQEFWGLDLLVSPAVLIPRPETEHVVETVLELVKEYPLRRSGTPQAARRRHRLWLHRPGSGQRTAARGNPCLRYL